MGVAALVIALQAVPLPTAIQPFWLLLLMLGAGFGAVYMYHRRTGEMLTMSGGARLGWITGLFVFLIMTILLTVTMLAVASDTGIRGFFRELTGPRGTPEFLDQLDSILASPAGAATFILLMLLFFFLFFTMLSSIGGALAAKVLEKD